MAKPLVLASICVFYGIYLSSVSVEAQSGDKVGMAPAIPPPAPIIRIFHIRSDIKYTYAKTSVFSKILNPADKAQEVRFKVTLPEEAFITGLTLTIKDKSYDAYVKTKEEAKKEYDDAVSSGQTAAHVFEEQTRDSKHFTVAVNVESQEKVSFNLTYEELLSRKNGTYKHEINVNPNQIVPDLLIEVLIEDVLNITNVFVPEFKTSNEIQPFEKENSLVKQTVLAPNKVKIEWKPSTEEQKALKETGLNGKLIVKYDTDATNSPQQILLGSDGYFVHILKGDDLPVLQKHIVFILDVSGSMSGDKLEQLKDAMKKIIQDLSELDHFSILIFSDKVFAWDPVTKPDLDFLNYGGGNEPVNIMPKDDHVVPANKENVQKAIDFITSLQVYGGTNIIAGLRNGLRIARHGQKLHQNTTEESMIIFLTDGHPNTEEWDHAKITEKFKEQNTGDVAVFSLGFGFDLNFPFLKNLSIANGGIARRIYADSDASLQLQNFYEEISSPVLSDVKFNYLPGQVENTTLVSHRNLFSGSELVVLGHVKPAGTLSGSLTANSNSGVQSFDIPTDKVVVLPPPSDKILPENKTFGFLEKMWAYKTIKILLDKHTVSENETVKEQAKDLALKYSFVTPLTSLVVVKPNDSSLIGEKEDDGRPQGLESGFSGGIGAGAFGGAGAPGRPGAAASPAFINAPYAPVPLAENGPVHSTIIRPSKGLYYSNVSWLNQTEVDSPDGPYLMPPESLNTTDVIALYQGNLVSGQCQDGRPCRHFIYCIQQDFLDDIDQFIPNQCHIFPRYLGVCCPL